MFTLENLIPAPRECRELKGAFVIDERTAFEFPEALCFAASQFRDAINRMITPPLRDGVAPKRKSGARIVFELDKSAAPESFHMEIGKEMLRLAGDVSGVFYGVQLLRQMLLVDIDHIFPAKSYSLPCCVIDDAPRFSYRGFMIDSARHFQSVDVLKALIEKLALYRINRLHWHLMDNYGYRVLLAGYPELSEFDPETWFNAGVYTPSQIREVVDFAHKHCIEVIPEIEMPAHSGGVFKSHPELACDPDAYAKHIYEYCIGSGEVRDFLHRVLREIMSIFADSRICHIGGDEARHETWEHCPVCCAEVKQRKLKDMAELEHRFMLDMSEFVRGIGFRAAVWASKTIFPKDVLIQAWHEGEAEIALAQGCEVVNSVHNFVYFDYPANDSEDKFDWMPSLPLEKVYDFEPVPAGTPKTKEKLVIGGEACLWTEKVPEEKLMSKVFPRLCAFAEIVWCPRDRRDRKDFLRRVKIHMNSVLLSAPPAASGRKRALSIADIARAANVSKTAVSLFMNGKAEANKIAMETCARIATTIRNNHYRPNVHARAMQKTRCWQTGLLLPDGGSHDVFWPVASGAIEALAEGKTRAMLDFYAGNLPAPRTVDVDVSGEDGALQLLVAAEKEDRSFLPPRVEVIVPGRTFVGYVEPDFAGIGTVAANSVVKSGHRKIAVLTYGETLYGGVLSAFRKQLEALGCTVRVCGDVDELVAAAFGSSAVYCDGTRALLDFYAKANAMRWDLRNDVAVLAAASRELAAALKPQPAVIDFDWHNLGLEAAKLLLDIVELRRGAAPCRIVIPASIAGGVIVAR